MPVGPDQGGGPRAWALSVGLILATVVGSAPLAKAQNGDEGRILVPSSVEFQVNQYTFGHQDTPAVAHLDDGRFGIFWSGPKRGATPPHVSTVHVRIYERDGTPVAPEEVALDADARHNTDSAGASRAGPNHFAVTWQEERNMSWGQLNQLFTRLIDRDQVPLQEEPVEISDDAIGSADDFHPRSAPGVPDGYVVVWKRNRPSQVTADAATIMAVRMDAVGKPATDEIEVSDEPDNAPIEPVVATLPDGTWLVTWAELFRDSPDSDGILLRRFEADGTPMGDFEIVNTHTEGNQRRPWLVVLDDGRFVVLWKSFGQDGDSWGIYGQRYDAGAHKVGAEFRINTTTQGEQRLSRATLLEGSQYAVFWVSLGQDGDRYGLFGRHFDWDEGGLGPEFQVNVFTTGDQGWLGHAASSDGQGNLVVAWAGGGDQDGDSTGIFSRRYCLADPDERRCGLATVGARSGGEPTATDAQVALNAAVGLADCPVCECDSDGSGRLTSADALRILRASVGLAANLACPACCSS